jgi:hypothetical protein
MRGANSESPKRREIIAPDSEIRPEHEQVWGSVGDRSEELHSTPFWKERQRLVGPARTELDRPVVKGLDGLNAGAELDVDLHPFLVEEPEFLRREHGKHRVRN